jgi:hypothetical protein
MSFLPYKSRNVSKVVLKLKKCIDTVLKPLIDNIDIKVNGSLTHKDIFCTEVFWVCGLQSLVFTISQLH